MIYMMSGEQAGEGFISQRLAVIANCRFAREKTHYQSRATTRRKQSAFFRQALRQKGVLGERGEAIPRLTPFPPLAKVAKH